MRAEAIRRTPISPAHVILRARCGTPPLILYCTAADAVLALGSSPEISRTLKYLPAPLQTGIQCAVGWNIAAAAFELAADVEVTEVLESVATEESLREAYNAVQPKVGAFSSSIPTNAGLWKALKAFAETDEASALDPTRARFLEKTLQEFRRQSQQPRTLYLPRCHQIQSYRRS